MTKPLEHALDMAHLVAIQEMMYEADYAQESALTLIKIESDSQGIPDHYVLRYANGSGMVIPFGAANERAQHIGTDWWDCGAGDCRDHCQECHWGCQYVPSWLEGYAKC